MLNREKDAIIYLDKAERICIDLNMQLTQAKIKLIQISLEISNSRIYSVQKQLVECSKLFNV